MTLTERIAWVLFRYDNCRTAETATSDELAPYFDMADLAVAEFAAVCRSCNHYRDTREHFDACLAGPA